jgi:phosphoribosylglycinamide formyltransferase-1
MKIAAICSKGGSPVITSAQLCPEASFFVLTDRACGVEAACDANRIAHERIEEPDARVFSEKASERLHQRGPFDAVIMLFSRLVTGSLLTTHPLLNIHPSLLPAFRGFGAIKNARVAGVRWLGTTLHQPTEQMDDGPIVAQACSPVDPAWPLTRWEKISYVHKVGLILGLMERLASVEASGEGSGPARGEEASQQNGIQSLSPALRTAVYLARMRAIERKEEVRLT